MLTLFIFMSFLLTLNAQAAADGNKYDARLNKLPHLIEKGEWGMGVKVATVSIIVLVLTIYPAVKYRKYQNYIIAGVNAYFFFYENFGFKLVNSPFSMLCFIAFALGIVFCFIESTQRLSTSITSSYVVTILACVIVGVSNPFIFYILEALTACIIYFVLSHITFISDVLTTTATNTYLFSLIFSCIVYNLFADVFSVKFSVLSGTMSRFIILVFVAVSFFLPGILKLLKVAIFGFSSDAEEIPAEEKVEEEVAVK